MVGTTWEISEENRKLFGDDYLVLKAVEECAELAKELMHFRDGKSQRWEVAEELADVLIIANSIARIVGPDEVMKAIRLKEGKLLKRIAKKKKEVKK